MDLATITAAIAIFYKLEPPIQAIIQRLADGSTISDADYATAQAATQSLFDEATLLLPKPPVAPAPIPEA